MSERITAQITYKTREKAQWVWDTLKKYPEEINGIKIEGLSFGSLFRRCDIYQELYRIFKKLHSNEICNIVDAANEDLDEEELEIKNKITKLEEEIEETWKENF